MNVEGQTFCDYITGRSAAQRCLVTGVSLTHCRLCGSKVCDPHRAPGTLSTNPAGGRTCICLRCVTPRVACRSCYGAALVNGKPCRFCGPISDHEADLTFDAAADLGAVWRGLELIERRRRLANLVFQLNSMLERLR